MKKSTAVLCRKCTSLANPTCQCGLVAVDEDLTDNKIIAIYTDDLNIVELLSIWEDENGEIHHIGNKLSLHNSKICQISSLKVKDAL